MTLKNMALVVIVMNAVIFISELHSLGKGEFKEPLTLRQSISLLTLTLSATAMVIAARISVELSRL